MAGMVNLTPGAQTKCNRDVLNMSLQCHNRHTHGRHQKFPSSSMGYYFTIPDGNRGRIDAAEQPTTQERSMHGERFDVVVIGGGNAALCAALAAAERGAKVGLLERAPEAKRGGNSNFTGGGFRMVHHGAQDIRAVVPDLSDADIARTDFGEYSAEEYLDDLGRTTQYYIDPDLAETLVKSSTETVHWLMQRGVKFLPNYGRQAYNHEGRFKFFGGIVIYANGGGAGLVQSEYNAAAKHGISIRYGTRATALLRGPKGIEGVR